MPGIGRGHFSDPDDLILRQLAYETMPLIIIGDYREPLLVLNAELKRFPYARTRRETEAFQLFAVRLIPDTGRIARIFSTESTLAVNKIEQTPNYVAFNLGNGTLYLEVYPEQTRPEDLPILELPAGFQENAIHRHVLPFAHAIL